ncbi:hypothetical protein JCM5353_000565 [Sporobolomyces roseus]
MVATRTIFSALTALTLAASSSAQLLEDILGINLDLGLLQPGALVTADVFADVLSAETCPVGVLGVTATILNIARVCACVNILDLGAGQEVCECSLPNSSPICARGQCACVCDDGFVSDSTTGTCVDENACGNSGGTLQSNGDGSFLCVCPAPLLLNGQGTCSLPASARARAARRNLVLNGPAFALTSGGKYCSAGETACSLPSGNYECIDTRDSLTSCGGCPGQGGVNCLAIEGALSVTCSNSRCQVGSCFSGYRYENGRCI